MYPGDGARGKDHARLDRLAPAGEDIQRSRQAMMNSPGRFAADLSPNELSVDVTGKLDRSPTRPIGKDRAEHKTIGGRTSAEP
jgi:hypothetical protein